MSFKLQALCACATACGLAAGGAAHAQFLDLDVRTSHSGYEAGMPQFFPTTAATQPNGEPTFYGGAPATLYSLTGTNFEGQELNAVSLGVTPLATFLAENPDIRLIPAAAARSAELTVRIEDVTAIADSVSQVGDLSQFTNACEDLGDFNLSSGFPVGTVAHPCDAIDATARLNGVTFKLSGEENRTTLRLVIPEVGFDFATALGTVDRSSSLTAIDEAFFASGKAPLVVAKLLGKPEGFVLAKGVLPNEGTAITGSMTVGGVTKSFGVANPGQLLAYVIANRDSTFQDFGLDYSGDCFRLDGVLTGACTAATATLNIVGVEVRAEAAANSPDITFSAPDLGLTFTSAGAEDRDQAIEQFADYAEEHVDRRKLTEAYARYLAQNSPNDPLVGNPFSAQGQLTRGSLDLDTPSDALDESEGKGREGGGRAPDTMGWMIGGRAGHLSAGSSEAQFVDGMFERGFRVREGSRARVKISVPVSYVDYGSNKGGEGGRTGTIGVRATLELPLVEGRWVVEPTVSAAGFYSSNNVSSGALYLVGVSSRYKLAPVGRGHLVIGNAITYSSTFHIEAGPLSTPKIENGALRNGVAYQVPYGRFMGRQGTVRASYTYTHMVGDDLFVDKYHEVSLSYGVASREASVRQVGEVLRFGINGAFGHDFTAVALTAGYRF